VATERLCSVSYQSACVLRTWLLCPDYTRAFFFQAEDGIRDWSVTGVQTCALPICNGRPPPGPRARPPRWRSAHRGSAPVRARREIGRASCRERVQVSVVAVPVKNSEGGRNEGLHEKERRKSTTLGRSHVRDAIK